MFIKGHLVERKQGKWGERYCVKFSLKANTPVYKKLCQIRIVTTSKTELFTLIPDWLVEDTTVISTKLDNMVKNHSFMSRLKEGKDDSMLIHVIE